MKQKIIFHRYRDGYSERRIARNSPKIRDKPEKPIYRSDWARICIKAYMEDYRVFYTSIPRLITQIRESRSQKTLRTLEAWFEKFDLVICDEFGYISFDKEGAEMLFNHLSLRAGRKSTVTTTNLAFNQEISPPLVNTG